MIAIEGRVLERFGHQRPGQLLDLAGEAVHARSAVTAPPRSNQVEGERIAQEIEDRDIRTGPGRAHLADGCVDDRAIFRRRCGGGDVGAVNGKVQEKQLERRSQPRSRVVAGAVVASGDACQQARQCGELASQQGREDTALGLDQHILEAALVTTRLAPSLLESIEAALVEQNA